MTLEIALPYLGSTETDSGASRYQCLRKCPRAHHLRYELGLRRPQGSLATDVGSLCHAAIRYVTDDATRDWVEIIRAHESASDELDIQGQQTRAIATRLLDAYFHGCGDKGKDSFFPGYGVPGWPEGWEPAGTEVHLAVELGGRRYTTALDTLLRRGDELLIVDTKTASGLTRDLEQLARQLRARPQFLGSVYATQKLFSLPSPPRLMVNFIVKNVTPRFERVYLEFSEADIERWRNMHELSLELAPSTAPNPDACWPMGGDGYRCDYFEYCHEGATHLYEVKT